jgi:hypothetical protein
LVTLDEKDWSEAAEMCGAVAWSPRPDDTRMGKKSIATGAVKCHLIVDKKKIVEIVWQLKFNPIKSKIFNSSKW